MTMKKELITSEQEKQIRRVTEDAVNKGLEVLKLTNRAAQQILNRGGELQDAVMDKLRELGTLIRGCLKCISGGKKVILGATDGTETLANASDVFNHIDSDFKNWGCDVASESTPEIRVEVHEMIENGDLKRIFGGFNTDLNQLCLSQSQIKRFVKEEADNWLLPKADWTGFLFLFKLKAENEDEEDEFFVARVPRYSGGYRRVYVYRFSDDRVWSAVYRFRVVIPQLALES